jgi:NADH-quinone oxidoreductase subunit C
MSKEELKEKITKHFPGFKIEESCDFPILFVPKEKIIDVLNWLKNEEEIWFDMLACQTAVDRQPHFEMIYHLTSTKFRYDLVIKVLIEDRGAPEIESVYSLWKSAELFECEIYDLFGIRFKNHPNLRRLFMPEDWEGFPLRKDYDANKVIIS